MNPVAIGNIGDLNVTIGLNSDNTVSVISDNNYSRASNFYVSIVYIPTNNKVLVAYFNEITNYAAIRVGTVAGNNVLFGEEVVISENLTSNISAVYVPHNDKVVLVYKKYYDDSGVSRVVTIKDDIILLSEEKVFKEKDIYNGSMSATYDPVNGKVVIAYGGEFSKRSYIILGTIREDSIFFSDPVVFNDAPAHLTSLVYDSVNNKVVITYFIDHSQRYVASRVVTINDDQVLLGKEVIFDTTYVCCLSTLYDHINDKVVVAYDDAFNTRLYVNLGTVEGDNIHFSTKTLIADIPIIKLSLTHNIFDNKIFLVYHDEYGYITARIGSIKENNISISEEIIFDKKGLLCLSAVSNPINGKLIMAYYVYTNGSYAAVRIGTIRKNNPFSDLKDNMFFSPEIVFSDTNIRHISAIYVQSKNKVIVVYSDHISNPRIISGVVYEGAIHFSKPKGFIDRPIFDVSTAYNHVDNKLFIAYRSGLKGYGTVITVAVEKSGLIFEKEEVFNHGPTYGIKATYDSANNRVVVYYRDINNNHGSTVVYSNTPKGS